MQTTIELAKAHAAAEDRQDVEATLATFSKDSAYTVEAFGVQLKGHDQIRQHYAGVFSAWPDFVNSRVTWYEAGDDVWAKAFAEFTHSREWNGIRPNGKRIGFSSVAHFPRAKDGLLAAEHVYMNGNDLLYQLGALPSANAFEIAAHIRSLEGRINELEQARRGK
jgi:steroid delta-isomerase-like uncharacterized protein